MRLCHFILLFFLLNNMHVKAITFPSIAKNLLFTGHWTIAAGLTWLEAAKYISLASEKNALEFFGNQQPYSEQIKSIKMLVQQHCTSNCEITIRIIKKELQPFVLTALFFIKNLVFVNPLFYEILTPQERRAAIIRAIIVKEQNYIFKTGFLLTVLPFVTEMSLKYSILLIEKILLSLSKPIQQNIFVKYLTKSYQFIVNLAVFKCFLNIALATAYFKHKAKEIDAKVILKLGSTQELLSYYMKINKKVNELLRNNSGSSFS